jgi:threonine aldolase
LRTDRWGRLALEDVARAIRVKRAGYPRTGVVCIENTHNRCNGVALPVSYLRDLKILAHERGVPVHMDGARIFNAAAALGVDASDLAAEVDSVQFCLSKGLGAPVGSVVVMADADRAAEARTLRRRSGGAMRQAGVLAAAGSYALAHHVERLAADHARAQRLATALADTAPGLVEPKTVETNIVPLDLTVTGLGSARLSAQCRADGVLISAVGPHRVRLVTHLDVDDAGIDRAIAVIRRALTG